jgi:hypothetical protein
MQSISNIINKAPDNFLILQAKGGFFGSLVYRAIAGSSKKFVWEKEFTGCKEDLSPLEWPKLTEGFDIYDQDENRTYTWFKENHLTTAHISLKLLEKSTQNDILKKYNKNKILIIKTHDMNLHSEFSCKIVRIVGSIKSITKLYGNDTTFRRHHNIDISQIKQHNLHNLNIEKFMSVNFDIFIDEYLKLCNFLDIPCNINNVRQFILLSRDKLKRYRLTLP